MFFQPGFGLRWYAAPSFSRHPTSICNLSNKHHYLTIVRLHHFHLCPQYIVVMTWAPCGEGQPGRLSRNTQGLTMSCITLGGICCLITLLAKKLPFSQSVQASLNFHHNAKVPLCKILVRFSFCFL